MRFADDAATERTHQRVARTLVGGVERGIPVSQGNPHRPRGLPVDRRAAAVRRPTFEAVQDRAHVAAKR
eukprot:scaffold123448_cov30-Tisochrysis_lutea.AAC.1